MSDKIDFANMAQTESDPTEGIGMMPDDFKGGNFLTNPDVGMEIEFTVTKNDKGFSIVDNPEVTQVNNKTGKTFGIGIKNKKGVWKRYDIYTDAGIYTIKNWELYFKLVAPKTGILQTYAKKTGTFEGAKVSIKKLLDGSHASVDLKLLAAGLKMTEADAEKYQDSIKAAIKESRLYEVKLLN
jgi:hypothetical protein